MEGAKSNREADDDGASICDRCVFKDVEVWERAGEDNAAKGSAMGWDDFVTWCVCKRDAGLGVVDLEDG